MEETLAASLSYPTVVYSILLVAVVGYWLIAIIGLVGVDTLDFDFDGPDVDLDADVDADVDMDADAHADGHGHTSGATAAAGFWSKTPLRKVPVSIAATLVVMFSWLACQVTTHYAGNALTSLMPHGLWGSIVLGLGTLAGIVLANLAATPLGPLFHTHEASHRGDLVGKVVEIRTGLVDRQFGQASADDGGAGLLVQVRCEPGRLRRGQKALVISHDEDNELYEVEPLDELLNTDS